MKARCYNQNDSRYYSYGGRGITVCDEWINDFEVYARHLESLPNCLQDGYQVDRTDNDGNYEPGNVRWITTTMQQHNRSMRIDNTSGYVGVRIVELQSGTYYRPSVYHQGHENHVGSYRSMEEAVNERNAYIISRGWPHSLQAFVP